MEKLHWRKTAKICPKCQKIRSAKYFIPKFESCVHCEYDNIILKEYKKCCYCRTFFKKEEIKNTICDQCLKIFRDKHEKFKKCQKLKKGNKYICISCKLEKSHLSFHRGSDFKNLKCKTCITKEKIQKEGKFRCKGCGSVFKLENIFWNKYCERCFRKNREWNKEKMKKLRKDPYWRQYFRDYNKWKYWNVDKPLYNRIFALQWQADLLKKRKINRNGHWFVLNHKLFNGLKRNFRRYYEQQNKIIEFMKTGKGRIVGDRVVLDNIETRKKFDEYLDSEEGMRADKRPIYIPETFPIYEYFKE